LYSFIVYRFKWIDPDNQNDDIRRTALEILEEEISWSIHLGLQAVMLPPPPSRSSMNYSRIINQLCSKSSRQQQLWLQIPLENAIHSRDVTSSSEDTSEDSIDSWETWRDISIYCNYTKKLGVALVISEDLFEFEDSLKRWLAEPVKAIILHTRVFIPNKQGFPVLSSALQKFIFYFLDSKIHIILTGKPKLQPTLLSYVQYIRHLETKYRAKKQDEMTFGEKFTIGYKDYLQAPLQPLMDNLESQTYDVFEKDPVKYNLYQEAVEKALIKIKSSRIGTDKSDLEIKIAVLVMIFFLNIIFNHL